MATRVEVVTVKLREMIVTGQFTPGSRVPERDLAELLGVSRTPVRVALGILEAEGLVSGAPNCGFVVRPFQVDEILSAYDVRGVLEGLAARTAVERGLSSAALQCLEDCVAEGESLLASGLLGDEEMRRWSAANDVFHGTLLDAAALPALNKTHAFISRMPLAAPIAIMFTSQHRDRARDRMAEAHSDHMHVLDALRRGQGARAEQLMREHAQRSRDNLAASLAAHCAQPAASSEGTKQRNKRKAGAYADRGN